MNSLAQNNVTSSVTQGAVNRVADMAGRKVADLAIQKAMPALRTMDTRKTLTLAVLIGVGLLIFRALNRDGTESAGLSN